MPAVWSIEGVPRPDRQDRLRIVPGLRRRAAMDRTRVADPHGTGVEGEAGLGARSDSEGDTVSAPEPMAPLREPEGT